MGLAIRQRSEILKMHKQFTATSFVTLLVLLGAGILLTVSLQKAAAAETTLMLPNWLLWGGELLLYLGALLIWLPNLTFAGLLAGMLGMFCLRLLIGLGSGALFSVAIDASKGFSAVLPQFLSGVFPRSCSAIFALLAFYPIRFVLPRKGGATLSAERPAKKAGAQDFVFASSLGHKDIGQYSAGGGYSTKTESGTGPQTLNTRREIPLPEHLQEAKLTLPLAAIELQLPSGLLRPEINAQLASGALEITLPLRLVASQLKDALLEVTLSDLLESLPSAWVEPHFTGGEDKVVLPLLSVIPQIPEELFKLPEKAPLAWCKNLPDEEKVLFARV